MPLPPTPDDPLQSPQDSDSDQSQSHAHSHPQRLGGGERQRESRGSASVHNRRLGRSPLSSISSLPYRRSSSSLSNLFTSTTALPTHPHPASASQSGRSTPVTGPLHGPVFSPTGTSVRSPSPAPSGPQSVNNDIRDVILRAYSPHVSVLASQDTDELVRHKGIPGGLLELLRPFGEHVSGKVTIRDSTGVSRIWEDYAVQFVGVKDGLEDPRKTDRSSTDSAAPPTRHRRGMSLLEYRPARLRTGGDVAQVEELVERHLTYYEENSGPVEASYLTARDPSAFSDAHANSPFYTLYLRRLLSGLPMNPAETFSHPVASVITISSRSQSPIDDLRTLYASSNTGENRLPEWVHNEFIRYYVLIHDEDYDDITKSIALYEQMKRHFGLNCHLLRLRSQPCVSSDDDAVRLAPTEWTAAGEELAEIVRREANEEEEDPTPYIFESDASALRAFVREMVTQSIIPSMERDSATWNDQVASRRRGLSGRFMSLSKRFTTFGARNSSGPALGGAGSNYDSLQGVYRNDAPEAIMRKLADYAMMLRDFRLAHSTYDILCQDFKTDKAWRHYAGANEMAAVSLLLATQPTHKIRIEGIDNYLDMAYYTYVSRVGAPYNALRALILGVELLKMRGGNALDDAARWLHRILDNRLVGSVGHCLLLERIATCFHERTAIGGLADINRYRKSAFWHSLAADAWLRMEKASQADRTLSAALRLYHLDDDDDDDHHHHHHSDRAVAFDHMAHFLSDLQAAVSANRGGVHHLSEDDLLDTESVEEEREMLVQQAPHPTPAAAATPAHHAHRKSLSQVATSSSSSSAAAVLGTLGHAHAHRRSISSGAPPLALQRSFDPLTAAPGGASDPPPGGEGSSSSMSPIRERREIRDDGFE